MKKLIFTFLFLPTLLLTGCFGENGPAIDGVIENGSFVSSDVMLDLPQDWEAFTDIGETYPPNTLLVTRNNVKANTFIANVNLAYVEAEKDVDLNAFANQMMETHRDTLLNFKEVSRGPLEIKVGGEPATSVLNVFEGKRTPESQKLAFLQTYGYKGNTVYIVTGMYNFSEERFAKEKVENTVRSFEIK